MKVLLLILVVAVLGYLSVALVSALVRHVLIPRGRALRAPVEQIHAMRTAQAALGASVSQLLLTIEADPALVQGVGQDKLLAVYQAMSALPPELTKN